MNSPRVALIAGPTGSGKSALALALAELTGGTIVNADASQVYRDLRVVTARPSAQDEARAPHRLFGYLDAAEPCTAPRWAADAIAEIDALHLAGRLPILVGGTGLYLRVLLDGIAPMPPIDSAIRAVVRALPAVDLHAALLREDPASAARLRPSDTTRLARALEVARSTGLPIGEWQSRRTGGIGERIALHPLLLMPPRDALNARLAERFGAMLDGGAPAEVAALLARELDPALPAMRAIGVREIGDWIAGRTSRDEALAAGVVATRRYAKRQFTWFAHQTPAGRPCYERLLDASTTEQLAIKLRGELLTR